MYKIRITTNFKRDLKALDRDISSRIISKIEWLAKHPEAIRHPLKHIPKDLKGLHKYRIGNYRVLFWVDHNNKALTLYGIEHRRSVYDKL